MKWIGITGIVFALSMPTAGAAHAAGAGQCDGRCTSPAQSAQMAAAIPRAAATKLDAAAKAASRRSLITVQAPPEPSAEGAKWRATREVMLRVQRTLTALGYDPGPIDGAAGPSTRRAIAAFQKDSELEETGQVTEALVSALDKDIQARDNAEGDEEAADQSAAATALEPVIEITDDPASYDLGDLSDLNSFD